MEWSWLITKCIDMNIYWVINVIIVVFRKFSKRAYPSYNLAYDFHSICSKYEVKKKIHFHPTSHFTANRIYKDTVSNINYVLIGLLLLPSCHLNKSIKIDRKRAISLTSFIKRYLYWKLKMHFQKQLNSHEVFILSKLHIYSN